MKAIVECAGGKMLTKQPSFRKIMEHKQNKVCLLQSADFCIEHFWAGGDKTALNNKGLFFL
ncbi:UNVERIFIED_CONTAM: hypothetical protein FKN15_030601 [Acipenser sinensis]